MSKWKEEIDENGDVWLDFGFWRLHCGDMEDLDKEHFEVIALIVKAPELLVICADVLEGIAYNGTISPKTVEKIEKFIKETSDNFGEFSEDNLLMFSMQRKEL